MTQCALLHSAMKRGFLVLLLFWVLSARADDGVIFFGNNLSGFRAPIYGPDPSNPTLSITGQSLLGSQIPGTLDGSNTQNYNGLLLQGSGYTFAIYAGPLSANSNSLTLVASTVFRTATADKLPAGLTFSRAVIVPGVQVGEQANYQIRVWDNQGGTLNDWATVQAAWLSGETAAGATPVVASDPLGGYDSNGVPVIILRDNNWVSFNIYYIPEPEILAALALSAIGFIIGWKPRKP